MSLFDNILNACSMFKPGSQYDNTRACIVFVTSVVLGNTQLDQGYIWV